MSHPPREEPTTTTGPKVRKEFRVDVQNRADDFCSDSHKCVPSVSWSMTANASFFQPVMETSLGSPDDSPNYENGLYHRTENGWRFLVLPWSNVTSFVTLFIKIRNRCLHGPTNHRRWSQIGRTGNRVEAPVVRAWPLCRLPYWKRVRERRRPWADEPHSPGDLLSRKRCADHDQRRRTRPGSRPENSSSTRRNETPRGIYENN